MIAGAAGATGEAERYTRTAIVLHWLMAALILSTLVLGYTMSGLPFSPRRIRLFNYHKWIGVTILAIAAARLAWRVTHRPPALPDDLPHWQRTTAHAAHALLYLFFFAVPLSGWAYSSAAGFPVVWLGLVPLPDWVFPDRALAATLERVHAVLAYTLAAIVAVHIVGAIRHTLAHGSSYLRRMTSLRPRTLQPGTRR